MISLTKNMVILVWLQASEVSIVRNVFSLLAVHSVLPFFDQISSVDTISSLVRFQVDISITKKLPSATSKNDL